MQKRFRARVGGFAGCLLLFKNYGGGNGRESGFVARYFQGGKVVPYVFCVGNFRMACMETPKNGNRHARIHYHVIRGQEYCAVREPIA